MESTNDTLMKREPSFEVVNYNLGSGCLPHGVSTKPLGIASYSGELNAFQRSKIVAEASDPELKKLFQEFGAYYAHDEAVHAISAENNLFHSDKGYASSSMGVKRKVNCVLGPHDVKDYEYGNLRCYNSSVDRPTDNNIFVANRTCRGTLGMIGQHMIGESGTRFFGISETWVGLKSSEEAEKPTVVKQRNEGRTYVAQDNTCRRSRDDSKGIGDPTCNTFQVTHSKSRYLSMLERKGENNGLSHSGKTTFCHPKTYKNGEKGSSRHDKDYQDFLHDNSLSKIGPSVPQLEKKRCGDEGRGRVKKITSLFKTLYEALRREGVCERIDFMAASAIKNTKYYVDFGKKVGDIIGVEVGDEFHYRMELSILCLHKPPEAGIDYVKHGKDYICTSVIAIGSGDYVNDMRSSEIVIYSGQGGNVSRTRKEPEDQRLVGGNLAMKNSINVKNPIRVIRGHKVKGTVERIYIYDGLYIAKTFWKEEAAHGKSVFKFELARIPEQPKLSREQWMKLKGF